MATTKELEERVKIFGSLETPGPPGSMRMRTSWLVIDLIQRIRDLERTLADTRKHLAMKHGDPDEQLDWLDAHCLGISYQDKSGEIVTREPLEEPRAGRWLIWRAMKDSPSE